MSRYWPLFKRVSVFRFFVFLFIFRLHTKSHSTSTLYPVDKFVLISVYLCVAFKLYPEIQLKFYFYFGLSWFFFKARLSNLFCSDLKIAALQLKPIMYLNLHFFVSVPCCTSIERVTSETNNKNNNNASLFIWKPWEKKVIYCFFFCCCCCSVQFSSKFVETIPSYTNVD